MIDFEKEVQLVNIKQHFDAIKKKKPNQSQENKKEIIPSKTENAGLSQGTSGSSNSYKTPDTLHGLYKEIEDLKETNKLLGDIVKELIKRIP